MSTPLTKTERSLYERIASGSQLQTDTNFDHQPEKKVLSDDNFSVAELTQFAEQQAEATQDRDTDLLSINTLGAAMYNFIDTGSAHGAGIISDFISPGAEQEFRERIDFEAPAAKIAGAAGSFAGYIYGAPMRVGMKLVGKGITPLVSKIADKRSVGSALKRASKHGKKHGLDKKTIDLVTTNTSGAIARHSLNPALSKKAFEKSLVKETDALIRAGRATGKIKAKDAEVIKGMIGKVTEKGIPVQDMLHLGKQLYGNTGKGRFLGQALNDIFVFSFVDAAMEGIYQTKAISRGEQKDFDWMNMSIAVGAGVATGIGLGALEFAKPIGKMANSKKDFLAGIKAWRNSAPYSKLTRTELAQRLRFYGEHDLRNGGTGRVKIGKKEYDLVKHADNREFGVKSLRNELNNDLGPKFKSTVAPFLNKKKNEYAKNLAKESMSQSWGSFKANFPRMIAGGVIFNVAHVAQMRAYGAQFGVDYDQYDLLSNMLIGAYTQRKANPQKWDLSSERDINTLREGLISMGFDVPNFDYSASFSESGNRFGNGVVADNTEFRRFLEENRFSSDDDSSINNDALADGEKSVTVAMAEGETFPMLAEILKINKEVYNFSKTMDEISVVEARKIIKQFKKTSGIKNIADFQDSYDKQIMDSTSSFETQIVNIVRGVVEKSFPDLAKKMTTRSIGNEPDTYILPQNVRISDDLKNKARAGELEFLGDLRGEDAVNELQKAIDSYEVIQSASINFGASKFSATDKVVTIENTETLSYLFDSIRSSEKSIDNMFPQKDSISRQFRFSRYQDYLPQVMANKALSTSKKVISIFSKDYGKSDDLQSLMINAGILDEQGRIVNGADRIDSKEGEEIDSRTRGQLERILSLQTSIGGYEITSNKTETTQADIDNLKIFLKGEGFNVDEVGQWYYQKLIDVVRDDILKNSKLQSSEIDFLWNQTREEYASAEFNQKTGKNGFVMRRVRVNGDKRLSEEYNTYIQKLANKSDGLVRIEDNTILIDSDTGNNLANTLKNSQENLNTNEENIILSELFEALRNNGLTSVKSKMEGYIMGFGHEAQTNIMTWLKSAKLVKANENYDLKLQEDKIAYEFFKEIDNILTRKGYDDNFVDRQYELLENQSKGRLVGDADDVIKNPAISLQQFFTKYMFIDSQTPPTVEYFGQEPTYKYISYENQSFDIQKNVFDSLINNFPDPTSPDKYFVMDALDKISKRVAIERNNEIIPFENLSKRSRYEVLEDITQIVFGRKDIMTGKVIKSTTRGLVIEDKPYYMQQNPITDLFQEMDIDLNIFNPEVIIGGFNPYTRKYEQRLFNLDDISQNIPDWMKKDLKSVREKTIQKMGAYGFDAFNNLKSIVREDDIGNRINEAGPGAYSVPDAGLIKFQLFDGMDSIIIKASDRTKIAQTFDDFYNRHVDVENSQIPKESGARKILDSLQKDFKLADENETPSSSENYELATRFLVLERMLRSKTNKKLYDIINEQDPKTVAKALKRVKLVNTKNFVRPTKEYMYSIVNARKQIDKNDKAVELLIKRITQKDGWTVSIWNDEGSAIIRDEVNSVLKEYSKKYPQISNWSQNNVMGNAHKNTTAFDSISFVSRDALMEYHALMGHNPSSLNPIKPVISSNGEGAELLLGKTLFVYEPKLDSFFSSNKVDILITKSGAKVFEEANINNDPSKTDESIINGKKWNELSDVSLNAIQKRKISIDSIGLKPEKDSDILSAKESPSDANLFDDAESALKFAEVSGDLDFAISQMEKIVSSPISMRRFMIDELGDGELPVNDSNNSINTINNMLYYLSSPDSNPMSYSDRMVRNKLYSVFVNNIINNTRSVTNRTDNDGQNKRYGGQSYLVQGLSSFNDNTASRLLPTLVDENGKMLMRGEIALPNHERTSTLSDLEGRGIRIVDNEKVFTLKELFNDYVEKADFDVDPKEEQRLMDVLSKSTLEDVYYTLKIMSGDVGTKYQLGIISRRNPRTRPNDITLLGLAGFVDEGYGNSSMINSMDVANIYEGDYDADKIDYFFAHNDYFFDHIKRSSSHFVQAIDPSNLEMPRKFTFALNPGQSSETIQNEVGAARSYKKAIGMVQKTPRELNYLDNLSNKNWHETDAENLSDFIRTDDQGNVQGPGLLFKNAKGEAITIDYRNIDFFMRSALEMQYIVDGAGDLNPEIAADIFAWKDDFLFPKLLKSKKPSNFSNRDAQEIQNNKGSNNDGQRVRIFQKLVKGDDGRWKESDLDLTEAEKAIIKQFISEYSDLLQITGKENYSESGEAQRIDFDSFINGAEKFTGFNKNLKHSIWKNLTDKRVLSGSDYTELKEIFGWNPAKKDKKKKYQKAKYYLNNEPFEAIQQQATGISKGENGSYIDRLAVKIARSDLFKKSDRSILDDQMDIIDDWYQELMSNSNIQDADTFNRRLVGQVLDVNKKIGTIRYLTKKIKYIENSNYNYKWKNDNIKKLKYVINKLKTEVQEEYGRQNIWKLKPEEIDKIEFVNLENDPDLKDSTIHYNTVQSLLKTELIGASRYDSFYDTLNKAGRKDLKLLKSLRSKIYGDNSLIKEIAEFGDKSVLSTRDIEILSKYDVDSFYDWQMQFLNTKIREHGIEFLMAFMSPSTNRKRVGVYKNRAVSIPYVDSSRYRLGVRFLTDIVYGKRRVHEDFTDSGVFDEAVEKDIKDSTKMLLETLTRAESHYYKFFNGMHTLRRASEVNRDRYGLAKFDPYLDRKIKSYEQFSWVRNNMPYNTMSIVNNSVIDFYKNLYEGLGRSKEFDIFLEELDAISIQLASDDLTDPYKYIGMRLRLDSEFQDFISKGIDYMEQGETGESKFLKITDHPTFKLSKGFKFMKEKAAEEGLTLEKSSQLILKRIGELSKLDANLNKARESMIVSEEGKVKFDELKQSVNC